MYADTRDRNRRRDTKKAPVVKDYRPDRYFMVAVPIRPLDKNGKYVEGAQVIPQVVKVGASSAGAAIEGAKSFLVARKQLLAHVDIRFTAVATEITAQVGDTFDGDEAKKRATKTSLDTLRAKVFA
jgi:hypothetical protein